MKKKIKLLALIIVVPIAGWFLYQLFLMGLIFYTSKGWVELGRELRVSLLYKTDHQDLLEACRKVLKESELGLWEKERTYQIRSEPHPDINKLPKEILDTNPSYLVIQDGTLIIEFLGGLDHFGVRAYSEDFEILFNGYEYEDKMLTEGLWYYDDGYSEVEDYEKMIESLRPEEEIGGELKVK